MPARLCKAVEDGDKKAVERLLAQKEADVNEKDEVSFEISVPSCMLPVFSCRSRLRFHPKQTIKGWRHADHYRSCEWERQNFGKVFLGKGEDSGFDFAPVVPSPFNVRFSLFRFPVVRWERLIAAGAKINAQNKQGYSALMVSAGHGHDACLRLVLSAGAIVDLRNNEGQTAAMLASANGHSTCLQQLLDADANVRFVG